MAWMLVGWVGLCLAGEGRGLLGLLRPGGFISGEQKPDEPIVQLRRAGLPHGLGFAAVHYWFAGFDPADGQWHRWEVWQKAVQAGPVWGHLHRDLFNVDRNVGGGPTRIEREWRGEEARRLLDVLASSSDGYPYPGSYRPWPGPNSNTYVAWVLRRAAVGAQLDPRAIGRDYLGLLGANMTTTRTGVQVESPVIGLKAGLRHGVELHVLGLTFGVGVWPPSVMTPIGRVGFRF